MEKLEQVRAAVCTAVMRQGNEESVYNCMRHCEGLQLWCQRIAQRRGLDAQLAETLAWLHDVYYFTTGIEQLHPINSAEQARLILHAIPAFSEKERQLITSAILNHESMQTVNAAYDELIKDAHVLLDYAVPTRGEDAREPVVREDALGRLLRLVPEWKLLPPHRAQVHKLPSAPQLNPTRAALGEVAQTIAQKQFNWVDGSAEVRDIVRYYVEPNQRAMLDSRWAAAFVYHCCQEAGFYLPVRHPQISESFAGVRAWRDFASLLTCGYYHPLNECGFNPERGDIVIFDRLISDKSCDHIGIVVQASADKLFVAEGNAHGENCAAIVSHSRARHVRGYVRIPDGYEYANDEVVNICNAVS